MEKIRRERHGMSRRTVIFVSVFLPVSLWLFSGQTDQTEKAKKLIDQMASKDSSFKNRKYAAVCLPDCGIDAVVPPLVKVMATDDDVTQTLAAEVLYHLQVFGKGDIQTLQTAVPILRKIVQTKTGNTQLAAAVALACLEPQEVKYTDILGQSLMKTFDDDVFMNSALAMFALGKIAATSEQAAKAACPWLFAGLLDKKESVRSQAVEALKYAKIPSDSVAPLLVQCLQDHSCSVRISATYTLGHHLTNYAVPCLEKLLDDPAEKVRRGAAWALRYAPKDTCESVILALSVAELDSSAEVREVAKQSLQILKQAQQGPVPTSQPKESV